MIQLIKYFGLIGTNFEILMFKIVIEQAIKFPLVFQTVHEILLNIWQGLSWPNGTPNINLSFNEICKVWVNVIQWNQSLNAKFNF